MDHPHILDVKPQKQLAAASCILVLPGLRKQIWENSTMLVRQLPNIGEVGAVALKERQLSSLEASGLQFVSGGNSKISSDAVEHPTTLPIFTMMAN